MTFDNVLRGRSLIHARDYVQQANDYLQTTLRANFPVGSSVQWKRGAYTCTGLVESHGYGDCLLVSNDRSGKKVKISSFEIVEACQPREVSE